MAHDQHPPITPDPTEEEAAAIVAALVVTSGATRSIATDAGSLGRWRWSGRWWTKPVPLGRDRPW